MKNIKITTLLLMFCTSFFFSCERELETEGISRITNYPDFAMSGEDIVVIVKGSSFTDPGVKATEGGKDLAVATSIVGSPYIDPAKTDPALVKYSNSFDVNVPGIYTFTYSAVNSDGYPGSTSRTVIVLDKAPDPTVDLSGHYTSGTSPASDITKVADGVFYATNFWGGGSVVILDGYILTSDGINLNIPMQESLVPIYGHGKRLADGTLDLLMTRPTFSPPLVDQVKVWKKS